MDFEVEVLAQHPGGVFAHVSVVINEHDTPTAALSVMADRARQQSAQLHRSFLRRQRLDGTRGPGTRTRAHRPEWNGNRERTALAQLAVNGDGAPELLGEFLHESEADPATLAIAAQRARDTVEALEDTSQLPLGDAYTAIADDEFHSPPFAQENPNRAARGVLERVRQEVEDYPAPDVPIYVDRLVQLLALDRERDSGALRNPVERCRDLSGQTREIHRLEYRMQALALIAGEMQNLVHQLQELRAVAPDHAQRSQLLVAQGAGVAVEDLLQGPEHQRQRST